MSSPACAYLIDASPYIFRAYFSLPPSLTDGDGRPVNAVRGFTSFLLKLLQAESPSHLALAFDGSLTTSFRNDIYPPYKAHRELPPEELEAQLGLCREVAEALGAPTLIDDRFEADDILGALSQDLERQGLSAVVVTSDKDLAQLVSPRVTLYDFGKEERYTPEGVVAKFGVRPEQIAHYLALAGDAVDNIPGVRGVGAKSAAALLQEFDDLDSLYRDLERVASLPLRGASSLSEKLEEGRDDAFLSLRLATVAVDAPFAADAEDLAYRGAHRERVEPLFARLGFERLQQRIPRWRGEA